MLGGSRESHEGSLRARADMGDRTRANPEAVCMTGWKLFENGGNRT